MEWIAEGIYNDENMPKIEDIRQLIIGIRISPLIDVSAAKEKIGTINSGKVNFFFEPLDNNDIEIMTSVDNGGSWDNLINEKYIANAERLNGSPYIKIKCIIKSYIAKFEPDNVPKVKEVSIILSNKDYENWEFKSENLLWKGGL